MKTVIIKYNAGNVQSVMYSLDRIGAAYLYMGDFEKAADSISKALTLELNSHALSNMGVIYYYLGFYEKSIDFYQQAIRIDPNNVEYFNNIADAYVFSNNANDLADEYFKKSLTYSEKDIRTNEFSILGYLYLSLAHLHFERLSEASSALNKANQLDPNYPFLHYVNLRLSIIERNEAKIKLYAKKLKAGGYSEKLITADPYFSILKEKRFQDVFKE